MSATTSASRRGRRSRARSPTSWAATTATDNHFWAVRHLNLDLAFGESLAVIGPNGAGKSTLLLALAGILSPSEGEIVTRGQVSTLLTLGAGFEQELTGRDNIDLAGAFLNIPQKLMDKLTPSIIEFADIGAFIDAPVRTYSSGMRARLGFSIATAVTPDILLLDEVLGTGDQTFREKSQIRIRELVEEAKAIVLVTHDLTYVTEFCNRAVLLERGQLVAQGDPAEVVACTRSEPSSGSSSPSRTPSASPPSRRARSSPPPARGSARSRTSRSRPAFASPSG